MQQSKLIHHVIHMCKAQYGTEHGPNVERTSTAQHSTAYHITPYQFNCPPCLPGEAAHQGVPPVQTGLPPLRVSMGRCHPGSLRHAISQQNAQVPEDYILATGSKSTPCNRVKPMYMLCVLSMLCVCSGSACYVCCQC